MERQREKEEIVAKEQLGRIKEREKKEDQRMNILSSREGEYIKSNEKKGRDKDKNEGDGGESEKQ